MRKEDCLDLFKRIPETSHPQVNIILQNGLMLTIDTIVRFEPTYMVFRGREGGNTDEGRAFFVPYEDICYLKIERAVRLGELKKMYGEEGYIDAEDRLSAAEPATPAQPSTPGTSPAPAPAPVPAPVGPTDPGSIAKQNLLERIRAARANVAGATGKLGGKQ